MTFTGEEINVMIIEFRDNKLDAMIYELHRLNTYKEDINYAIIFVADNKLDYKFGIINREERSTVCQYDIGCDLNEFMLTLFTSLIAHGVWDKENTREIGYFDDDYFY
jgi:hypothetical protein